MLKPVKTCDIERRLPPWASVVKRINSVPIYNMNIFENIMSWNQENLDTPAFDYYGTTITYGELPDKVNEYACGLRALGITEKSVVTLCLPVSIENMLLLFALNCIGAIANNVNYLFLKSDFDLYTRQKGSDTLVVLDAYLPQIVDYLESSHIKNVIVTNLLDYLPEDNMHVFDDLSALPTKLREVFDNPDKKVECIHKITTIKDIRFIPLLQMLQAGRQSNTPLYRGPVEIERDISYSYTSGTTGKPKCIVYKESSANAFIEMHAGLILKDYVGERVFQTIPLTHATGERVSGYLQMAKGKTLVPIPIYNKESFGMDVAKSRCSWIVAAPSFYLAAVAKGIISITAWQHVTRPSSGGEPVTKANVELIDRWLHDNGCKSRFAIGGGAAEDGSGTIFTYFMDEETKTNETGYPLEPFILAKIVDENGVIVSKGQRGYLQISSPAAADRYLNDPVASAKRWYYDENGVRWGVTGDIAVQNADGSYSILGRASDSFLNRDGQIVYLFDIEYSLDVDDPVIEWEITAHATNEGSFVVGQIVLKKDCSTPLTDIVELLCKKYHLDAVKFYEKFENSDVTGKRDILKLNADKDSYYAPCDDKHLYQISYLNNKVSRQVVSKELFNTIY